MKETRETEVLHVGWEGVPGGCIERKAYTLTVGKVWKVKILGEKGFDL